MSVGYLTVEEALMLRSRAKRHWFQSFCSPSRHFLTLVTPETGLPVSNSSSGLADPDQGGGKETSGCSYALNGRSKSRVIDQL